MRTGDEAWDQIWLRSKENPWREYFEYPPGLDAWLDEENEYQCQRFMDFGNAFRDYLEELRNVECFVTVQVKVIKPTTNEWDERTCERIIVRDSLTDQTIATFGGDELDYFIGEYECSRWHDVALEPPTGPDLTSWS